MAKRQTKPRALTGADYVSVEVLGDVGDLPRGGVLLTRLAMRFHKEDAMDNARVAEILNLPGADHEAYVEPAVTAYFDSADTPEVRPVTGRDLYETYGMRSLELVCHFTGLTQDEAKKLKLGSYVGALRKINLVLSPFHRDKTS